MVKTSSITLPNSRSPSSTVTINGCKNILTTLIMSVHPVHDRRRYLTMMLLLVPSCKGSVSRRRKGRGMRRGHSSGSLRRKRPSGNNSENKLGRRKKLTAREDKRQPLRPLRKLVAALWIIRSLGPLTVLDLRTPSCLPTDGHPTRSSSSNNNSKNRCGSAKKRLQGDRQSKNKSNHKKGLFADSKRRRRSRMLLVSICCRRHLIRMEHCRHQPLPPPRTLLTLLIMLLHTNMPRSNTLLYAIPIELHR